MLPLKGAWVQSLVRELRFHILLGVDKKKKTKKEITDHFACGLLDTPKCFSGFPGGSDGKESACNEGDQGLIPGLGRFPAGGHGNPL